MREECDNRIRHAQTSGILLLFTLVFSPPMIAATPDADYSPGQIERQLEDSSRMTTPDAADIAVKRAPATLAVPAQPSFILSAVLISGVSVYKTVDFVPLYQQWLGAPVTYTTLLQIANSITRLYHKDGYPLARAFIPKQQISHGVVRIQVLEGYIRTIDYGRTTQLGAGLESRLQAVQKQRPLSRNGIQHLVAILQALPDIEARPQISESDDEPGAFILHLNLTQKSFDGSIAVDNKGSEATGPIKGILNLRAYNISGNHETYQLKLATTAESAELRYAELSTTWPLLETGLTLHASGFRTTSHPGGDLQIYDVNVDNSGFTMGLSIPLVIRFDRQLTLSGDISYYRSQTDVQNLPYLEDRLDHVTLRLSDTRKPSSVTLARYAIGVTQGLDLDNTYSRNIPSPEPRAETNFTRLNMEIFYRHNVFRGRALTVNAGFQYALDKLPNSQRFSVGGNRYSNANDPSEITGDHGAGLRIELTGKRHSPFSFLSLRPYTYYGIGNTWEFDSDTVNSHASAASLGMGMRWTNPHFSGFIEIGKPLTMPVAAQGDDGKQPRAFAGLSVLF